MSQVEAAQLFNLLMGDDGEDLIAACLANLSSGTSRCSQKAPLPPDCEEHLLPSPNFFADDDEDDVSSTIPRMLTTGVSGPSLSWGLSNSSPPLYPPQVHPLQVHPPPPSRYIRQPIAEPCHLPPTPEHSRPKTSGTTSRRGGKSDRSLSTRGKLTSPGNFLQRDFDGDWLRDSSAAEEQSRRLGCQLQEDLHKLNPSQLAVICDVARKLAGTPSSPWRPSESVARSPPPLNVGLLSGARAPPPLSPGVRPTVVMRPNERAQNSNVVWTKAKSGSLIQSGGVQFAQRDWPAPPPQRTNVMDSSKTGRGFRKIGGSSHSAIGVGPQSPMGDPIGTSLGASLSPSVCGGGGPVNGNVQRDLVVYRAVEYGNEDVMWTLDALYGLKDNASSYTRMHHLVARLLLFCERSLREPKIIKVFEAMRRNEPARLDGCFGFTAYRATTSHFFSIVLDFSNCPSARSKCWGKDVTNDREALDRWTAPARLATAPRLLSVYPSIDCNPSDSCYIPHGECWVSWNSNLPPLNASVSSSLECSYEDGSALNGDDGNIKREWSPFCCKDVAKMHHRRLRRDGIFQALVAHKGSQPEIIYEVKTMKLLGGVYDRKFFKLENDSVIDVPGPFFTKIHAFKNYYCRAHDFWFSVDLFKNESPYLLDDDSNISESDHHNHHHDDRDEYDHDDDNDDDGVTTATNASRRTTNEGEEESSPSLEWGPCTLDTSPLHRSDLALDELEKLINRLENGANQNVVEDEPTPMGATGNSPAHRHRMRMSPFTHIFNKKFIKRFFADVGFSAKGL